MRPSFSSTASGLTLGIEKGTWYRALQTHFLPAALSTQHTTTVSSRFSGATLRSQGYPIFYLAENPLVALLEVQALLGSPTTPGGLIPNPRTSWVTINLNVSLQQVADLTDLTSQNHLEIMAQELTGDWLGYRQRGPTTTVKSPTGLAPTQKLGAALHGVPDLEGFKSISAKVPYHEILVVFPDKLLAGSLISWFDAQTGVTKTLAKTG